MTVFRVLAALWLLTLIVFAPDSIRWYANHFRKHTTTPPARFSSGSSVKVLDDVPYDWQRDGA